METFQQQIPVYFICDEGLIALNAPGMYQKLYDAMSANSKDALWLPDLLGIDKRNLFVRKAYNIPRLTLKTDANADYSKVDFDNSLALWGSLHKLPPFIRYDPRLWIWLEFSDIGYAAARQAMQLKGPSTVENHWTYAHSAQRNLMFGVLSRCYIYVALTIDDNANAADPFELSKFAIEKSERIRHYTWRTSSSLRPLIRGCLRAEKDYFEAHPRLRSQVYAPLAKRVSNALGVRLADSMNENDFYDLAAAILNEIGPQYC